ncbi:MAG: dihydroorotase, partial [bacterium]
MSKILIKNVQIVNEGKITVSDILIGDQRILKIEQGIDNKYNAREINGENKYLLPGVIDDQV